MRNTQKVPKTRKQLPKKIKILGKVFTVTYRPDLVDEEKQSLYGETHGRDYQITINSKQSRESQEATLFHEAVHAALSVAGLDHLMTEQIEEALVTMMESAFADVVDVYALGIDNTEEPVV